MTQNKISSWIKENKTESIDLLKEMVQMPSTQGNEKEVQMLVAETMEKMGLDVDVWELDGDELNKHPYFFSNRDTFIGSPNVVATLKGSGDTAGRSIILNGHVDVVPEGDIKQWDLDPYSGEIVEGKMYGRGVTDMKGGNVSLMMAIEAIQALGIKLKGDVIFQSVVEEESGGAGTLATILKGYTADAAIIPEPTNMKFFPKQQGSKWFRITVEGRTAHGGTRYHGVSAIEKSIHVIQHVEKLEKLRNDRIDDPLYANIPIPIPINIGKIGGGDWPSSVPDIVTFEGRFGIAPSERIEDAKEEFENWMKELSTMDPWFKAHPVEVDWFGGRWIPGEIAEDHLLMDLITSNYERVLGEQPIIEASPWGTDGGLLTQLGNTPSIVFGPGVTSVAHFSNEYIELEKVFEAAEIIALTIIDWCGIEES